MPNFDKIRFKGTFRNYQQRVLDNADKYLKDGKINIVAAPGSGKTILGLELIRRLNSPCIVFSPTTAIREQWGDRFRDMFLDSDEQFAALYSGDLHDVKLLTSVTYQALFTAVTKVSANEDGDVDCSDVDIFAAMREYGIKTIALDEAHHLRNEWQKALEKFISSLDKNVKIISLTATPPYDSEGTEWDRYMAVCGEIDEEIFVPELVAYNNLCPHQDYVYFNYPTESESAALIGHRENAAKALEELKKLKWFSKVSRKLNYEHNTEKLLAEDKGYTSLVLLFKYFGYETDKRTVSILTSGKALPAFDLSRAQTAIQFLLDGTLVTDAQKGEIADILRKHSVFDKDKVSFELNEKHRRTLISSAGKLCSIREIARSEIAAMGDRLHMLILTDYIKKDGMSKIASGEEFDSVSITSIFETLRRAELKAKIGVLSGSLIILPKLVEVEGVKHKKDDIPGTDYCTVDISGPLNVSVDCVGKLFSEGRIQILIGTKALLGEGWDSPCINSLILASFVGSFVLSNQMRGRAIRIDKNAPDKVANVWHLVTAEPEYSFPDAPEIDAAAFGLRDADVLRSCDFDILHRRFESFMGPDYSTSKIESGIDRISTVRPPFDKDGIESINGRTLEISADRDGVRSMWQSELSGGKFAVTVETSVPDEGRAPVFNFENIAGTILFGIIETILAISFGKLLSAGSKFWAFLILAAFAAVFPFLFKFAKRLVLHINPARSIKTLGVAVYKNLCSCGIISPSAKVKTYRDKEHKTVGISLCSASIHDQNVFNSAMTELLSPIDAPRYVLVSKNMFKDYDCSLSYACPTSLGKKKECAEQLAARLKNTAKFEPVYTHSDSGKKVLGSCRSESYINKGELKITKKYIVSH